MRNPVTGACVELVGVADGDRIVQTGSRDQVPIRWVFSEITAHSFFWQGHILQPDGDTWRLEFEFKVQRTLT